MFFPLSGICCLIFLVFGVMLANSNPAKEAATSYKHSQKFATVAELMDQIDLETMEPDPVKRKQFKEDWNKDREKWEKTPKSIAEDLGLMFTTRQSSPETCQSCSSMFRYFRYSPSIALGAIKFFVCTLSAIEVSRDVCIGIVDRLGEHLKYIVKNTRYSNDDICAELGGHRCLEYLNSSSRNIYWAVPFLPFKSFIPLEIEEEQPKKVLHISDIHLDLMYEEGSSVNCYAPLCCRSDSYEIGPGKAGFWGQHKGPCDIPLRFVENTFQQIGEKHGKELDYFFWTGDIAPHNIWETSVEKNLAHIKAVTNAIKKHLKGVAILPVIGNHEAHPVNMFVPYQVPVSSQKSTKWLYETLANDYWAEWINTPEVRRTFLLGGYYAKQLTPNWRAVVLNSNDGYKCNFWNMYDMGDINGQLGWLVSELDSAEENGYYVSILAHIPPTNEMNDGWLRNYARIVERYSHLITGAYNGHTHRDEIGILYDRSMKKPLSVNYIAGSLTTFSELNPMYKIYEMDVKGMPLDYQTYYTDMAQNNLEHSRNSSSVPLWVEGFRATEAYKMADLTPESWDRWRTTALNDTKMAQLYYQNYHRSSKYFPKINEKELEKLFKEMPIVSPFD